MLGLLDNYMSTCWLIFLLVYFVYRQMICRIILLSVDLDVLARLIHILFDLLHMLKWLILWILLVFNIHAHDIHLDLPDYSTASLRTINSICCSWCEEVSQRLRKTACKCSDVISECLCFWFIDYSPYWSSIFVYKNFCFFFPPTNYHLVSF
jgi:hypothetical protein